jgi:hypothetical protein
VVDHWIDDDELEDFSFTLSSLTCLEKLSIFTEINSFRVYKPEGETEFSSSLPAIIRLIKTAPSVQHVILNIYYAAWGIAVLGKLDQWSPLDDLRQSDSVRRPRIDIYISGEGRHFSVSKESVFDSLAENEVLMDLVKRGVVTLKSGTIDQEKVDNF